MDALRFLQLLNDATASADPAIERARLVEAQELWRGLPFQGVRSQWLEVTQAPQLVDRYLDSIERRADLDIADGRYGGLAACLYELVAQHPLRESLWVRLLVVLARSGRQAEALERYESVRVRLAEELGADPGVELQRVYAELLAGRVPSVDGGAGLAWRVPRQLPPDVADFAGRDAELAHLYLAHLYQALAAAGPRGPVAICAIHGSAGVGKSALAIHAAHWLTECFPDGQLYVDLHGATAGLAPLEPLEVLGRFLRSLGADPADVPGDVEEATAMFRSRVAGRRLLVVLDNAAGAAQVVPLLPAGPGCGVLVTSRQALLGLEGATHVQLEVLAPEEALELLGRLAGRERVGRRARSCHGGGGLVRLPATGAADRGRAAGGAARLAGRSAGRAAGRRAAAPGRAGAAEAGVRASFQVSYQRLCASRDPVHRSAARALGLLGVLDGVEVGVPVVARLLEVPEAAAERALERLVDAHLLQTPAPGRYRLHDLLRLYARELACHQHDEHTRAAVLTPALGVPVGSGNSSTSCDLGVFVDEAAEPIAPYDRHIRCRSGRWDGSE